MKIPPGPYPPFVKPWVGRSPPQPVSQVPGPKPPGSPWDAPPPRLPTLGGAEPYVPELPPLQPQAAPPPLGAATDIEAQTLQLLSVPTLGSEVTLYTTRKRWRACDVYADTSALTFNGGTITFRVYAVTQNNQRTLIRTGRLQNLQGAPTGLNWVVAARAVSERFEVTFQIWDQGGGPAPTGAITVTVAASDEAIEAPRFVGSVRVQNAVATAGLLSTVQTSFFPNAQLLGVQAINGAGGTPAVPVPRWLHMHDQATVVVAGVTPAMVWPLGNTDGSGVSQMDLDLNLRVGLVLAASSTYATTTLAADCSIQAVIR